MTPNHKIIVGYDDSEQAGDALAFGRQIADATGAELVAAHVVLVHALLRGGADPMGVEAEYELPAELEAAATVAGATLETVSSPSVARGLHELAESVGAGLIVVGSTRYGKAEQTVLGNVAMSLTHGSPCAVAVAPSGYRDSAESVSTIVVGYDGSPESKLALESAYGLARAMSAPIRVVTVAEPPTPVVGKGGGTSGGWRALNEAIEAQARAELETAASSAPDDVTVEPKLVSGDPVEALADEARSPGSILVVGSRAYGPVRRVLLGSAARALANTAPAPLVVYPRGMHAESAPAGQAKVQATA
jgi:nucleotide-binding universal stress UspA family protein